MLRDWQGSTRTVVSNTGYVLARDDYTAFGEEIASGIGLRTQSQGFGSNLTPRQKYALTERDDGTGLDHTPWRKLENRAGRWTGPDPYSGSITPRNPQTFNRYTYAANEPTNFVDPSGLLTLWCEWHYNLWPDGHITDFEIHCHILDLGYGGTGRQEVTIPDNGANLPVPNREANARFEKCLQEKVTKLNNDFGVQFDQLRYERDQGLADITMFSYVLAGGLAGVVATSETGPGAIIGGVGGGIGGTAIAWSTIASIESHFTEGYRAATSRYHEAVRSAVSECAQQSSSWGNQG